MHDLSNAFAATKIEARQQAAKELMLEEDWPLFKCRMDNALVTLPVGERLLVFEPGSGGFMGTCEEQLIFAEVVEKCICAWKGWIST